VHFAANNLGRVIRCLLDAGTPNQLACTTGLLLWFFYTPSTLLPVMPPASSQTATSVKGLLTSP
jgi:hypothetical protein